MLARRFVRCVIQAPLRTSSLLQRFRVFAGSRLNANPLERGLPAKLTARSVRQIGEAASRASLVPTKAGALSTCRFGTNPGEPMYSWCSRSVGDNLLARRFVRCVIQAPSRTSSLPQRLERGLPAKLTARSVRRIREAASRASLAPKKADELSTGRLNAIPD